MTEHRQPCRNMGGPPRSTISYVGMGSIAASDVVGNPRPEVYGTSVRFAVPAELVGRSPGAILRFLGKPLRRPAERHLVDLVDLIEARARELPLPDGCVVVPASPADRVPWPDALTGLAVVTKCSEAVWLRVKSPVFEALARRHEVSLLVPPAFAGALSRANP